MADFINTIDVLGDDAVVDGIITGTITEFKDDTITEVGKSAFRDCAELEVVCFPNVTKALGNAFHRCRSLKSADLPNLTDADAYLFSECESLSSVNLPKLTTITDNMFSYCAFQSIVLPSATTFVDNSFTAFGFCKNLEVIDLPVCTSIPGGNHFNTCSALRAFILRNTSAVCPLGNAGSFNNSGVAKGTGYIYVPRALVDSYKTATNWSAYASQFRALEDHTVDGTITGALDEDKI